MKVYGAKKHGKISHLVFGKEYEVSEETAKILVKNGQATLDKPEKKAKANTEPPKE